MSIRQGFFGMASVAQEAKPSSALPLLMLSSSLLLKTSLHCVCVFDMIAIHDLTDGMAMGRDLSKSCSS
eukprot:1141694-Amphidinium_carterae.1